MKKLLTAIALLAITAVHAQTRYVSQAGSDSANGLTPATAWRTLAKVNASMSLIRPGDSIRLRGGDVFFGNIVMTKSGTLTAPIVINSYGTGKAKMTGFRTASGWVQTTPGIWKAPCPGAKNTLMLVTMNDEPQQIGRTPNASSPNEGYRMYQTGNGFVSITDTTLSNSTSWVGAEVIIKKNAFQADRCIVTAQSNGVISYRLGRGNNSTIMPLPSPAKARHGYFFQNDLRTVDTPGEWWQDTAARFLHMHFGNANPSSFVVKYSAVDTLVSVGTSKFIKIDSIDFEGANLSAVGAMNTTNITISNSIMLNMGAKGVQIQNSANSLVENVGVANALQNAIQVIGKIYDNATVRNCVVVNTAPFVGMDTYMDQTDAKAIYVTARNNVLIEWCTVIGVGETGIEFQGNNVIVRYNLVDGFAKKYNDCSGIYTYVGGNDANPGTVFINRVVRNNIVINGIGNPAGTPSTASALAGVYLDGRSMNVSVLSNLIAYVGKNGIHCNNPANVTIDSNTIFSAQFGLSFMRWVGSSISNLSVNYNRVFNLSRSTFGFRYSNEALNRPTTTTLELAMQALGKINNNLYYSPSVFNYTFEVYDTVGLGMRVSDKTLSLAKLLYNQEASSNTYPVPSLYKLTSVGVNQVQNSGFATNITGMGLVGQNTTVVWDNTGKIDGGSVRLNFNKPAPGFYSFIHFPCGPVVAGQRYVLRFSTFGTSVRGIVRCYLRKRASPWTQLCPTQSSSFEIGRKDHEFIISGATAEAAASYVIEVEQESGTTYIDNVQLIPVQADLIDINSLVRLEYNTGLTNKTVSLPGSWQEAATGNTFTNSIILTPWSWKVLVKVPDAVLPTSTRLRSTVRLVQ